jgi:hypothetical protein
VASRRLSLLNFLQFLSSKGRRKRAEVFQDTLATRYSVSLRTLIRDLNWLRESGYLTWEHVEAAHGGFKCRFQLTADGIRLARTSLFDISSDIPTSSENQRQHASQAVIQEQASPGTVLQSNTKDNSPVRPLSIVLAEEWNQLGNGMLKVAKLIGLTEQQCVWLTKAARRYGTKATWAAMIRAAKRNYDLDYLDRVVWGMLRQSAA